MDVTPSTPKPKSIHWIALSLLVVSVCINYIDRGNLGVAAKSIERELRFPPDFLGILLGGFFWTYSLFQIVAGKLIDRWNVNWVYAAGFLLWSAATGAIGLTTTFWGIMILRLMLGAGESVAYPSYSKIIANSFPEHLRGTANALIDAGSKLGPALGVIVGVQMVAWLTWRGMFVAIGAVSLLWLVPWCFIAPKLSPKRLARASVSAPSYKELLSKRKLWGTVIGLFGGNYTWYFFLTWLPYYFETERHYTHDKLAVVGSLPFWAVAISSILFGLQADAIIRRGRNPGRVRQTFVSLGLLGCCIFMFAAILVKGALLSNTFIVLSAVSMGAFSSNHWAFAQTLAGPAAAGKWTGFENCIGNLSGVVGPFITGVILARTHSFFFAFAIACGVLLLGVGGFWGVVGEPDPVEWDDKDDLGTVRALRQPASKIAQNTKAI